MQRYIGKYGPLRTAEACYRDGYTSGTNWNSPWVPGGPWVCTLTINSTDPEWRAYCEATAENNREWLRGWHAARAETVKQDLTAASG